MFPSLESDDPVSGWHATANACHMSGISPVNATKIRHLVSTLLSQEDFSVNEKSHLAKVLGHSIDINRDVYQCPDSRADILTTHKIRSSIMGFTQHC